MAVVKGTDARPVPIEARVPAKPEPVAAERRHSEEYYDVKTTVFNALIDTIDLTQLAKLGGSGGARGDPRHRQRDHPDQERGDVDRRAGGAARGHLQRRARLRAARAAAGARRHRRHHGQRRRPRPTSRSAGKVQKTQMRFADNAQLMNICQRIVSQVGRRVDEVEPDLRRAPARRQPRQRDRAAAGDRRTRAHHPQVQEGSPEARAAPQVQVDLARGQDVARDHRPGALQRADLRRHGLGQDHAAQLPHRVDRQRRAHHHLRGLRPSCSCSSRTSCDWRRVRPISKARARSPCAISSETACACGPSASSSARCADRRRSTFCRP